MNTRRSLDELGTLQRTVLEILWTQGEATVRQVISALPPGEDPAYTTILSVLQKLEKAGWIDHRPDGRSHVYKPVQSKKQAGMHAVRRMVDRLFAGDPKQLLQHLIKDEQLADEDLDALRDMIDQSRSDAEHQTQTESNDV